MNYNKINPTKANYQKILETFIYKQVNKYRNKQLKYSICPILTRLAPEDGEIRYLKGLKTNQRSIIQKVLLFLFSLEKP